MAAVVVERLVLRAEMLVPQRQVILVNARGRRAVVGFVADIVVAGREIERVVQTGDALVETGRRAGIKVRDGGQGVHEVTDIDDEGEIAAVEITDDVTYAPVGQPVGLIG